MSDVDYPRFEVIFGGNDAYRETLVVDAEEFIGIKSYKAKGKRLSTFDVETINELEPLRFNTPAPTPANDEGNGEDEDNEGGDNMAGPIDTEINGETGIDEEYEDIVDPEIPITFIPKTLPLDEIPEIEPELPKKVKPAKLAKKSPDTEDEVIDNSKIKDDITGQLNLFD